jgi:hypothetical protein
MTAECKHSWRPYTQQKAKCRKCGHACPWTVIVTEFRARARVNEKCIHWQARNLDALREAVRPIVNKLFLGYEDWDEVIAALRSVPSKRRKAH